MVNVPIPPVDTLLQNNVAPPDLQGDVTEQTIGRSYKRLKLAETATLLQRGTSADLGKEVVHHHSVVAASHARPGWVDAFKEELKEELKKELKKELMEEIKKEITYPIMAILAKESNIRVRAANKTTIQLGGGGALLSVEQVGGSVTVGKQPTPANLGLEEDFILSRESILQLDASQLNAFYNVYKEESFRAGRLGERRQALLRFLCDSS